LIKIDSRKVYPNSTFTSNNLSVHFWTWRKQQQKNATMKGKGEEVDMMAPEPLVRPDSNGIAASAVFWNRALKARLLEVGRKVEEMMRDQVSSSKEFFTIVTRLSI
jgi:hypothetical protein